MPTNHPFAKKVLLCSPEHFDIVDVKNIHMEGMAGKVDKAAATAQWNNLHNRYEKLKKDGLLEDVQVISGEEGLEDMVFCANQTFPWVSNNGEKVMLPSIMRHDSRKREVPFFEAFFKNMGYDLLPVPNTNGFYEGMGDLIPHPGRRMIYAGYGYRTAAETIPFLEKVLETPIIPLQLTDPRFYHLDTCFLPISEEAVLIVESAFEKTSLQKISEQFKTVFPVPEIEAVKGFALNAHCLYFGENRPKTAIIQKGNIETNRLLERFGYEVIEVETGEFMKSGGSVFCMKMMFF